MRKQTTANIVVAGVGGQGNILISKILAECARSQGLRVIVGEAFGVSQRGGSVMSHLRIGDGVLSPISAEHGTHIICGLEPMEALRAAIQYIKADGTVVTNLHTFRPIRVNMGKIKYPAIEEILKTLENICKQVIAFDATELAEEAGGAVFANMVLLGALSTIGLLDLPVDAYENALSVNVPMFLDKNLRAFHLGRQKCLK
ncbi:indolepyruvate oxidoreductase subunit beta [Thermodesulfobacteriota bacterium]